MRSWLALACACALAACAGKTLSADKRARLAEIHLQLGVDALHKGMLPRAFDELLTARKLAPRNPRVLDALALAWRMRGDAAKAEKLYRQALGLGGGAPVHVNYANLLNALGRYPEAEREARKALEDPRYPNVHLALVNLGDALLGQKRYTEAMDAYRKAAAFAPAVPTPRLHEADALAKMGKRHFAVALLVRTGRRFIGARAVLGQVVDKRVALGARAEARTLLAAFIERAKDRLDRAWAKDKMLEIVQGPRG